MSGQLEESGEIRIECSLKNDEVYFVINEEKYTPEEFARMCSVYEGWTMKYEFV